RNEDPDRTSLSSTPGPMPAATASSWHRPELAVDDDPSSRQLGIVDGDRPERETSLIASNTQRRPGRRGAVGRLLRADGYQGIIVEHSTPSRPEIGEVGAGQDPPPCRTRMAGAPLAFSRVTPGITGAACPVKPLLRHQGLPGAR